MHADKPVLGLWSLALCTLLAMPLWSGCSPEPSTSMLSSPGRESPGRRVAPDSLGRASQQLLPAQLGTGVYLEMTVETLRSTRPRAARNEGADHPQDLVYDEPLPSGARVLYVFRKRDLKLAKIQLASKLAGIDAIPPRLEELQGRYGASNGIWDCPKTPTSPLPTRRFTWARGGAALLDVYLLVGENVLNTVYLASFDTIRKSLVLAGCLPTRPGDIHKFPIPTTRTKQTTSPSNP